MMIDNPEAMTHLVNLLTDLSIAQRDVLNEAAGGIENVTTVEWGEKWIPERKKGYVSCDLAAMYSPKDFKKYAMPANNKSFKKYGGGLIHNCMPHPSVDLYLKHEPEISGLSCDAWDLDDTTLQKIKESFKRKAILSVELRITDSLDSVTYDYERIMEILASNVIAIPYIWFGAKYFATGYCTLIRCFKGRTYNT
jgi:hypothetical protein